VIRTIKQRIYAFGLLPLAVLAVALVVFNGVSRIEDANRELMNARDVATALLQSPAEDALVVGNTLGFEQTVKRVIQKSPSLACVTLRDTKRRTIARVGRCDAASLRRVEYVPVRAPLNGLSDFDDSRFATVGELGLFLHDASIERQRTQVLIQLGVSLVMIAFAVMLMARVLRARLIEPIHSIGGTMQAVAQRDYNVRVPIKGDDELTRLAQAINNTITTVAEYTRELERRRSEADQALQDADAANLARDGLVRSLTEDLAEPLGLMHSQLTAIAMANSDPTLRDRIKAVIGLLQDAQSDFTDLIEIATQIERTRTAPWLDMAEVWTDIERDLRRLSNAEGAKLIFAVTRMASAGTIPPEATGLMVNIDGVRLKKALLYMSRALHRRCKDSAIHVNIELITLSADRLHVSVHLTAFCEPTQEPPQLINGLKQNGNLMPAIIGLTDRESKIIDYLLRAIGVTPTVNLSGTGTLNILLDVTCAYAAAEGTQGRAREWMFDARPVSATLVSNDSALLRFTTRGDMSNHELRLVSFSEAFSKLAELQGQDALLIDISDDMAEVLRLIETAKDQTVSLSHLIAIGPPGIVSESLSNRLFELGFVGILQKPLQYSRIVETIRMTLSHPLGRFGAK
jgi:HAMP domain-containing protein